MTKLASPLFALAALLAPTAALAADEGVLHLKIVGPMGGDGKMTVHFAKAGTRTELAIGGPMPMRLVSIIRTDEKRRLYQLNEEKKRFAIVDLPGDDATAGKAKYTVEEVGKATIAGYPAIHVKAKDPMGNEFEVWTSKALPIDARSLNSIMQGGGSAAEGFWEALKAKGVEGFVVKLEAKRGNVGFGLELEKVETKKVPKSTFDVPKDYQKVATMAELAGMADKLPPDVVKQMQEKILEKLPPEQREEARKKMQGQTP